MKKKPVIGITMGDPAGIGPEIIVKSLKNKTLFDRCVPIVIGDAKIVKRAAELLDMDLKVKRITEGSAFSSIDGEIACLDLDLVPKDIQYGKVSAAAGDAAFQYLKKAIKLANEEKINAICTAPLNKEALHKGGHMYPGHTEILAELTNTTDYSMMLSSPTLKVIHVTTHVGLLDAVEIINPKRVMHVIELANKTIIDSGIKQPRIGVCGINPHAGENGLFGYGEEETKIKPAIKWANRNGIRAVGPLPADSLFYLAQRGEFDIVVAMYHDQGHAPMKVLGLETGINITVGLPIIRTSVDHGTAFDIAGTGKADERSMLEALNQAVDLIPI